VLIAAGISFLLFRGVSGRPAPTPMGKAAEAT
jgi:hypothetical protein